MKNLSCVKCGKKIGIIEIFNVKPNKTYYCKECGEAQEPVYHPFVIKDWDRHPYYALAFPFVTIYSINFFLDNRWLSYSIGIVLGILAYLIYLIILVKTTRFK